MNAWTKNILCSALVGSAGLAQADLTATLGTVSPTAPTAFANPAVAAGTITPVGLITYNFLDKFNFTLATAADVASIVATIYFAAAPGATPVSGISNLQVNLKQVLPASSLVLVSWTTVTTPAPGLQQEIALTPTSLLGAGNYSLEVRGVLAVPGAYSGSLIAQAPTVVPLPAALPLLMLGLGAIGAAGVRRRRMPSGMA
jgi:hypothetical protein